MIARLAIILPVVSACSLALTAQSVQQYMSTQPYLPQPCTVLGLIAAGLFCCLRTPSR